MRELATIASLDSEALYPSEPFRCLCATETGISGLVVRTRAVLALTKWEDIRYVSSHPELFPSAHGTRTDEKRNPCRIAKRWEKAHGRTSSVQIRRGTYSCAALTATCGKSG